MRRRMLRLWRVLALIPIMGAFDLAGCQANILRDVAGEIDERADRIDGGEDDVDLGDYLADLVEDL